MAGHADAADSRLRLVIPPRSYADALIDFGLQANISILGTSGCGLGGRTELKGRYELEDALTRLLTGAPCRFRIVDARTVRIFAAPLVPAPAPQVTREPPILPALVSEVIVTATKRPLALDRLPASISAISGRQATSTGAVDVSRTVGQLAGVQTTNLGPGRDKLLIRGLSDGAFTGRTRSTVGTYLDNTPINYNAPDPDLRLVDIDRIEVVRGPQGALYGSGAVAGIYRIVTQKPDLETFAMGASALAASTRGGDASYEVDGYLSVPIVRERLAVRLVAYDDKQGGYLDDVNLRLSNVDRTRRHGGRLALGVKFNEAWRLDLLAATQNLRSNDTQYITSARSDLTSTTNTLTRVGTTPARASRVREAHKNDFSYVAATLQGDLAWGSVSSSLSYVHHVFSSQYDATETLVNFQSRPDDLGVFAEAAQADMLVQDLVVRSSGNGRINWLAGIYAANTIERTPSTLGLLRGTQAVRILYSEDRKDRRREFAAYGEASYDFGQGWSATLGGRLFESHVHTTADLRIVRPYGPRVFERADTYRGFSPKVTLQKEFATGELIYALISEGYRPGGFNSSGFFEIKSSRVTFAPDRLRNYELGAKLRRFDDRLTLRAAAYYDNWSRIQTDQYRPFGLAYTANVADARIIGLEAEAGYDWPFGLSVQLNGLISDSQIKNPNPDFASQVTGTLPGVPKISGGMLLVYQRPVFNTLTLRLSGEASYVGRSALNFDANQTRQMGHYLRARLSAELIKGNWRAMAFVNNPFNDAGDTFAYGNPFSFGQVRQVTPQRPRTVGLRLAASF